MLLAVACMASTCGPALVASHTATCDSRSGTTLAANRDVRVFGRERRFEGHVVSTSTYACNRRTGRLKSFGDAESGKDGASIPLLAMAGMYVSWVYDAGSYRSVVVWNAKTGATRVNGASAPAEATDTGSFAPKVTSLVVTDKGHVAWIAEAGALGPGYVVHT